MLLLLNESKRTKSVRRCPKWKDPAAPAAAATPYCCVRLPLSRRSSALPSFEISPVPSSPREDLPREVVDLDHRVSRPIFTLEEISLSPTGEPAFFLDAGGEFGGDQKWASPSFSLSFDEQGGFLDRRAKGETTTTKRAGGEKKSGNWGGEKQQSTTSSVEKRQSSSGVVVLDQSKSGSMTGVFNGNTPFQLTSSHDKRFKSLPPAEMLPRHETLGGYIFVCNNDTMQEDLKRQLFGLPQRYRDSVRAIQPGLPLFLYNYTTHQLHGIFEAASFGGSNIDPTAWEDKKCRGESRFPAQVRIRVRRLCKPLQEEAFRPILHHYDGPKFRLQLSVPETLQLLDLFNAVGPP
ncbi:hypothetical protein R1flu_000964 [Riccia fluitans]|uniref:DCD domain-containing protein n=1 Tax=Riccia fluitans TaxID=41844 RepID=A0ABD1Y1Y1_9MARC